MGKHGKKVTYGDWNESGILMTCSEEKMVTASNQQGDSVLESFMVKATPSNLKWQPGATETKKAFTLISGDKNILWYETQSGKYQYMSFPSTHGKILTYQWYTPDAMIIGFSSGIVSYVSMKEEEMGMEKTSISPFKQGIEQIAVNADLQKIAVASMGSIRFYNVSDWQELVGERLDITQGAGKMTRLEWTPDGSILTVATQNGYFFGFLTVIPSLYSSHDTFAALLSSLTEISVVDCQRDNMIVCKAELDIEPSFLSLGPNHFAVGINNSIWYYKWREEGTGNPMPMVQLVCRREYFGTIKQVALNDEWSAVLSDGKCSLHMIEQSEHS